MCWWPEAGERENFSLVASEPACAKAVANAEPEATPVSEQKTFDAATGQGSRPGLVVLDSTGATTSGDPEKRCGWKCVVKFRKWAKFQHQPHCESPMIGTLFSSFFDRLMTLRCHLDSVEVYVCSHPNEMCLSIRQVLSPGFPTRATWKLDLNGCPSRNMCGEMKPLSLTCVRKIRMPRTPCSNTATLN